MAADSFFQSLWYHRTSSPWLVLLIPLSWVFKGIVGLRSFAFRAGWLRSEQVSRPVIIVGNITVGGTGKTPLTLWLAAQLRDKGFNPGIVLRGYRGKSVEWPRDVMPDSDPAAVGDEAVLLANLSRGIVVAGPDRVTAARRAIARGADVVLSDDGLQHHRLARDCELAVIHGDRGMGNGRLLPAGPLREAAVRLKSVDAVVVRTAPGKPEPLAAVEGLHGGAPVVVFSVRPTGIRSLQSGELRSLASFQGQQVHAIAGIGHPESFFATLREAGLTVISHALPDHAAIALSDVSFGDSLPVLMTEKDAVKCRGLPDPRMWAVAAEVEIAPSQAALLMSIVEARIDAANIRIASHSLRIARH